jgi:hypothetical protein
MHTGPIMGLSDRALAELGTLFGLISIAGVGVPMIWPDEKLIGTIFLIFGGGGFVIVAVFAVIRICRERGAKLGTSLAVVGALLIILGSVIGLIGAFKMDEPEIQTLSANPLRPSSDQIRKFKMAAIAPSGGPHTFTITVNATCEDCQIFMETKRDALADVPGWNVVPSQMFGPPQTIRGLEVIVYDRNDQPEPAIVIQRALQTAGIEYKLVERKGGPLRSAFVKIPNLPDFEILTGPYRR